MCCDQCPRYEKCEENSRVKDECCPVCPEYHDCIGLDDREKDLTKDPYSDGSNEDSFSE